MIGQLPTKLMKWPLRSCGFLRPPADTDTSELSLASACRASSSAADVPMSGDEPYSCTSAISHFDDPEFEVCFDEVDLL